MHLMYVGPRSSGRPGSSRLVARALCLAVAIAGCGRGDSSADAPATESRTEDVWSRLGPVPPGFASWEELFTEQEKLVAVADEIASAPEAEDGLTSVAIEPGNARVRVHWKGSPPAHVAELLATLRSEASIDVATAPFSRRELEEAMGSLTETGRVLAARPREDGTGIDVTVGRTAVAASRAAALASLPSARTRAGAVVPISVSEADDVGRPAGCAGRLDDCGSPWGGAWVDDEHVLPNPCSTAFTVADSSGNQYMLTAAHCTGGVGHLLEDGGEYMGSMAGSDESIDLAWLSPRPGRPFAPFVYVGARDSAYALPVRRLTRLDSPYKGQTILKSGMATGTVASVVINTNAQICRSRRADGTCERYLEKVVLAERTDGTGAVGMGDSGGAIGTLSSDGRFFQPLGVVTWLDNAGVPCPAGSMDTTCGSIVGFSNTAQIRVRHALLPVSFKDPGLCPATVASHLIGAGMNGNYLEARNSTLTGVAGGVSYQVKGAICSYTGTFHEYRSGALYQTYQGTWSAFAGTF